MEGAWLWPVVHMQCRMASYGGSSGAALRVDLYVLMHARKNNCATDRWAPSYFSWSNNDYDESLASQHLHVGPSGYIVVRMNKLPNQCSASHDLPRNAVLFAISPKAVVR